VNWQAHVVEKIGRVANNTKIWINFLGFDIFVEQVEHSLRVVFAQAQKNAIIFFRLWVFCYRSHANDFTLIAYLHELSNLFQKPHVVFAKEPDVVFGAKVINEPKVLISNFWLTRNRSESLTCLGIVTSKRFERIIVFISIALD
jgi:hypothetical protein